MAHLEAAISCANVIPKLVVVQVLGKGSTISCPIYPRNYLISLVGKGSICLYHEPVGLG